MTQMIEPAIRLPETRHPAIRAAGILAVLLVLAAGAATLPHSAAAQGYGAIAFSPQTGQWGWSRSYRNRAGAADRAMSECRSRTRGCRIVIQVRYACASLAIGNSGWGAGWGTTQARANAEAMGACRGNSRNCSTRLRFCST